MVYTVVSAICIVLILGIVASIVIQLVMTNRKGRFRFLKNYKKGQFVLIYIAAVPLYCMAHAFKGYDFLGMLLKAIKSCIELVVLKYDYDSAAPLMEQNTVFRVAMTLCFIFVAVNALLFAITLTFVRFTNWIRVKSVLRSKRVEVVLGFNDKNLAILDSIKKKGGKALLLANLSATEKEIMYVKKIAHASLSSDFSFGAKSKVGTVDLGERISQLFGNCSDRHVNVIINNENDEEDLIAVKQISAIVTSDMKRSFADDDLVGLDIYVFGEPENSSVFNYFEEKTGGAVHYVDRYKQIANDFIVNYPLTRYMTEKQLDYGTATLLPDVELNVIFIGFGHVSMNLLLASIANNQFLTRKGENYTAKTVNYHIFEKVKEKSDKNLNHSFYRYSDSYGELFENRERYLELPDKACELCFHYFDVNSQDFYGEIKSCLSPSEESKFTYNYIVVSYGDDLENLDMAEKFSTKLKEWNIQGDTKVFMRIRNDCFSDSVLADEYASTHDLIAIGNENKLVYNIDSIVGERYYRMAQYRHITYTEELQGSDLNKEEIREIARKQWYEVKNRQVRRESNVYACLSLRQKLNLIGYDYLPCDSAVEDATAEFYSKYEEGNPIRYDGDLCFNGKRKLLYDNQSIDIPSIRLLYAKQEHLRWNAYMLAKGFLPAPVSDLMRDKVEKFEQRLHSNLTTFEGLKQYRKIMSQLTGKSEEQTDVIRYDFQLMDDVAWILGIGGFKIVRRKDKEN